MKHHNVLNSLYFKTKVEGTNYIMVALLTVNVFFNFVTNISVIVIIHSTPET